MGSDDAGVEIRRESPEMAPIAGEPEERRERRRFNGESPHRRSALSAPAPGERLTCLM